MKLEVACVCLSLGILGASLVGCGDDDYVEDVPLADASVDAAQPPLIDAGSDASAVDASTDPDAITQCQTCIFQDCGPALIECLLDETCREIATCVLGNDCLDDLQSCIPLCVDLEDLSPAELLQRLVMLQRIATSCTSCLDTCRDAVPGGLDAGF